MTARAVVLPVHDGGKDWARWSAAAAIVTTGHAVVVAGYLMLVSTEPPAGAAYAPAVIIDLAPVPVAPPSRADLAPGPEMLEAQPLPEPTKPVETKVVEPAPKLEAPAEVVLPTPEPKADAKPEKPAAQALQGRPVERVDRTSPAPQTTAAPRSDRRDARVARAPSPGSTEASAALASWRDLLVARLQRAKRYPASAEARNAQGTATLSFSVDRNGRVLSQAIAKSSGHSDLDQEVLAMIQRAQPLPPFPPGMTQSVVHLSMPIRFSLR
jgi:protein TonB